MKCLAPWLFLILPAVLWAQGPCDHETALVRARQLGAMIEKAQLPTSTESAAALLVGYEAGSVSGSPGSLAGAATDPGDLIVSWAMAVDPAYGKTYQPFAFPYLSGSSGAVPGITTKSIERFAGADLSYHLPPAGPWDLDLLAGCTGWQGVADASQVDLPMKAGIAAQAGMSVTFRLGSLFIQGRGLWRPLGWEDGAPPDNGTQGPFGAYSLMILGGLPLG